MASSRVFLDLNKLPNENINIQGLEESSNPYVHDREEVGEGIPQLIRSHSGINLVIDLNVDGNEEATHHQWDLNIEYVTEENGEGTPHEESEHLTETNIETSTNDAQIQRKNRFLTNNERVAVYNALLERSVNGKLQRHTTTEVSNLFSVPLLTVQRIWQRGRNFQGNVSHKKTKNVGRKRIELDLSRMTEIPLKQRTSLRQVAAFFKVSQSTLHKRLTEGLFRRHSNALKPHLKEENKRARLQFCLSMLDPSSLPHEPKFNGMYNVVHIDEKWFYITKKTQKYYLNSLEADPLRTCQSKNFIGKIMFLVAMARPRFDDQGNEIFSGKIGAFPLVTQQPAQRRSRNREVGTLEIKPITSVTREIIRSFLLEKVIPKIRDVWPAEDSRSPIFIQQDNARTHVNPNDVQFHVDASQNGFDIRLMSQPANSPDLNILDLGFFRAIQSLQEKKLTRNISELIEAVQMSFDEYSTILLNRIWVTYQLCMVETMKVQGSNRYKIPHVNKARLEREGRLPKQVTCDPNLVQSVMSQL